MTPPHSEDLGSSDFSFSHFSLGRIANLPARKKLCQLNNYELYVPTFFIALFWFVTPNNFRTGHYSEVIKKYTHGAAAPWRRLQPAGAVVETR